MVYIPTVPLPGLENMNRLIIRPTYQFFFTQEKIHVDNCTNICRHLLRIINVHMSIVRGGRKIKRLYRVPGNGIGVEGCDKLGEWGSRAKIIKDEGTIYVV